MESWQFLKKDHTTFSNQFFLEKNKSYENDPDYFCDLKPFDIPIHKNSLYGISEPLDILIHCKNSAIIIAKLFHSGKIIKNGKLVFSESTKVLWIADISFILKKLAREMALEIINIWDCDYKERIIEALKTGDLQKIYEVKEMMLNFSYTQDNKEYKNPVYWACIAALEANISENVIGNILWLFSSYKKSYELIKDYDVSLDEFTHKGNKIFRKLLIDFEKKYFL
jgi:hypothetical protein